MQEITVSHFTLNNRRVHQTMVGGMPAIAETEDEAKAWRVAREIAGGTGQFRGRGARWILKEWDGDTCELRVVEEGRTAA